MRRRALGQVILGLVLVAVLVFVIANRDRGDNVGSATTIAPGGTTTATAGTPSSEATTTTPPTAATTTTATPTTTTTVSAGTTAATTSTTAEATTTEATTTTLADAASPEYATGLAEARRTLTLLVEEMTATSRVFDNRYSTGPDYRMTRDAFRTVVAGVRSLAGRAADLEVPPALADLHVGSGGPIELTARLVPLAEAVLAGLRLPFPEDGSVRRAALDDYSAASEEFDTAINALIDRLRDDAENLGIAATAPDSDGLADDAALYLEELSSLTGTATRLLGEVRNLIPPVNLTDLHEGPGGPVELAGELSTLAQDVLAGLRLPEPDDGTDRRAAAAGYASVAGRFDAIADQLIGQSR